MAAARGLGVGTSQDAQSIRGRMAMAEPALKLDLPSDDADNRSRGKGDAFFEGYMAAVAVCPVPVPAAEWSAKFPFADDGAPLPPIVEMENAVFNFRLMLTLAPDDYEPRFFGFPGDRRELAEIWAEGFLAGMTLRPAVWSELMQGGAGWQYLEPISILALRAEAIRTLPGIPVPPGAVTDEDADEAIDQIAECVLGLHALAAEARERSYTPVHHGGHKIGRNEPCPCGSGRKYKRCCGG
jgi:uncharacterized protein